MNHAAALSTDGAFLHLVADAKALCGAELWEPVVWMSQTEAVAGYPNAESCQTCHLFEAVPEAREYALALAEAYAHMTDNPQAEEIAARIAIQFGAGLEPEQRVLAKLAAERLHDPATCPICRALKTMLDGA